MAMDHIDYFIHGDDMQFVEIELDPGEAAIGEAGSMMYMEDGIAMDTVFGDASAQQSGLFGKLVGAGKRLITGESLFTMVYTHNGQGKKRVAFATPYTGKIIAFDLKQHGGTMICQKEAFLCAVPARSGCNPCPLPAWPRASSPRHRCARATAAPAASRAACSAASSTATTERCLAGRFLSARARPEWAVPRA